MALGTFERLLTCMWFCKICLYPNDLWKRCRYAASPVDLEGYEMEVRDITSLCFFYFFFSTAFSSFVLLVTMFLLIGIYSTFKAGDSYWLLGGKGGEVCGRLGVPVGWDGRTRGWPEGSVWKPPWTGWLSAVERGWTWQGLGTAMGSWLVRMIRFGLFDHRLPVWCLLCSEFLDREENVSLDVFEWFKEQYSEEVIIVNVFIFIMIQVCISKLLKLSKSASLLQKQY